MIQTPETVLDDLFELLKDPDHWTQLDLARLADGSATNPSNPNAVKWCLIGGICKITDSGLFVDSPYTFVQLNMRVRGILTRQLYQISVYDNLEIFNDCSTHSKVLDLIDVTRKSLR
jgi:hypothetical protein